MMKFRTVKTALKTLLNDSSLGNFRVIGFDRQAKGADEFLNNDRLVQVYYTEGEFPKSSGGMRGSKSHNISLDIDLTCSAKAQADLSILDNPAATEAQKANALAGLKEAAEIADEKIDELIDRVYQIIMDARNERLGLTKGFISSRWIDRIQKDSILERGDLVVKTANMRYTCRVQESVLGDTGFEPDSVVFDSSITVGDTEGSGVLVENS